MEEISYSRGETQPLGHLLVMKGRDGWRPPKKSQPQFPRTESFGHSLCIKSKRGSLPSPEDNLMNGSKISGWRQAIVCIIRSNSYRKKVTTNCERQGNDENGQLKKVNCSATARNWAADFYTWRPPLRKKQCVKVEMTRRMPFFRRKISISWQLRKIVTSGFHCSKLGRKRFSHGVFLKDPP